MAKIETKIGLLSANDSNRKMRIIVNRKQLIIQETVCGNPEDNQLTDEDLDRSDDKCLHSHQSLLTLSSRLVHLHRSPTLGLGLSIKGGAEHNLPVLISRIVADSPADLSKQLFIGDEIVAVNGHNFDTNTTHDEALELLRGQTVGKEGISLRVRHHKAANILRKRWHKEDNNQSIDLQNDNPLIKKSQKICPEVKTRTTEDKTKVTNDWSECVRIELFLSHLSRYVCYSDKLRDAGFEVRAINGQSVVVQCDNEDICHQWCQTIRNAINSLSWDEIRVINKGLPQSEHILFMDWVSECQITGYQPKQSHKWSQKFLVIKGGKVYLLKEPPICLMEEHHHLDELNDQLMTKSVIHYNCYESVFRSVKQTEQLDEKRNSFIIQSADDSSIRYLATEVAEDLVRLKKAWHRANYHSVTQLGSKTFPVICDGMSGSLTLDWRMGFALYDQSVKKYKFEYRFHQLKHSSDDGNCQLSLTFVTNPNDSRIIETQLLECNALQNLLYCMHAFLSAKVASVDPRFLQSLDKH